MCDYCGGAVAFIASVFVHLHRSRFNIEFETLSQSVEWLLINGKMIGCFLLT